MSNRKKWMTIGLLWLMVALFFATQQPLQAIIAGEEVELARPVASEVIFYFLWFAITPLVLKFTAVFPIGDPRWIRPLIIHALLGFMIAIIHLALYCFFVWSLDLLPWDPESYLQLLRDFAFVFHMNVIFYWLIISLDYAVQYYVKSRERALAAARLETLLADSKLQYLKMQLQPHFLFNTMNTISVLMREDVSKANHMLVRFSELLRQSLSNKDLKEAPVIDEVGFLKEYLTIEQTRFGDRLEVFFEVDETIQDALLPTFILQPLIENAIKHGINQQYGKGRIDIDIKQRGERIRIEVRDNGPGLRDSAERQSTGTGLSNTRSRLQLMYGDDHLFQLGDSGGRGFVVVIEIPLRRP